MANIYVRSTDGNNSDTGATWALAKLDLVGAAAIDAAGDTIYVSDAHAESTAAAISVGLAGTIANPVRVICGDDVAEPPTAVATTATVTTTGTTQARSITLSGVSYWYGISFVAGSGTSGTSGFTIASAIFFESCNFHSATTGTGNISTATGCIFKNCTFKFGAVGQVIALSATNMFGGGIGSGGTTPTSVFNCSSGLSSLVEGFDFSNCSAGVHLVTSTVNGKLIFRNCKLPASWSGNLISATPTNAGARVEMYNCAAGDTNYALWVEDNYGSIKHETTIVKTGGASDGTTALAWKMATNADAALFPQSRLVSPEIVRWNETTGSAITVTIDIIHDSLTNLTDAEVWIEVQYLGTSGVPLSLFSNDAKADVLATAADQTGSSSTWTTTGLTNPNKQQVNVTFTPQEKGIIHAKVIVCKASYTVYVNPVLDIT